MALPGSTGASARRHVVQTADGVERILSGSGCEVWVGEGDSRRFAEALLDSGIELAKVKQGTWGADPDRPPAS